MMPDCPRCDAVQPLEPIRSQANQTWWFCNCCAATVLTVDGHMVRSHPKGLHGEDTGY